MIKETYGEMKKSESTIEVYRPMEVLTTLTEGNSTLP